MQKNTGNLPQNFEMAAHPQIQEKDIQQNITMNPFNFTKPNQLVRN